MTAEILTLEDKLNFKQAEKIEFDENKKSYVILKTEAGEIKILLNTKEVPNTANNFFYLAKVGFYNDTVFHRTIPGFMIQGGDPIGNGTGGPNYRFDDEKFTGQYERGTVAMANAGPNTNGSQFFIMHDYYPLPPNYTIFGKVVSDLSVIDTIAEAPTLPWGEGSTPKTPIKITAVEVIEE